MAQKSNSKIISVVHPICCGLDVHKDMVSACIVISTTRRRPNKLPLSERYSDKRSKLDKKRALF